MFNTILGKFFNNGELKSRDEKYQCTTERGERGGGVGELGPSLKPAPDFEAVKLNETYYLDFYNSFKH